MKHRSSEYVTYLKVDGINPEHECMHLAEGEETVIQVIYLGQGIIHTIHDDNAMLPDIDRVLGQVLPVGKVGFG